MDAESSCLVETHSKKGIDYLPVRRGLAASNCSTTPRILTSSSRTSGEEHSETGHRGRDFLPRLQRTPGWNEAEGAKLNNLIKTNRSERNLVKADFEIARQKSRIR